MNINLFVCVDFCLKLSELCALVKIHNFIVQMIFHQPSGK